MLLYLLNSYQNVINSLNTKIIVAVILYALIFTGLKLKTSYSYYLFILIIFDIAAYYFLSNNKREKKSKKKKTKNGRKKQKKISQKKINLSDDVINKELETPAQSELPLPVYTPELPVYNCKSGTQ